MLGKRGQVTRPNNENANNTPRSDHPNICKQSIQRLNNYADKFASLNKTSKSVFELELRLGIITSKCFCSGVCIQFIFYKILGFLFIE